MFEKEINFIKSLFPDKKSIALHEPVFKGNEKAYVAETIDSTFVSSVGEFVTRFESMLCEATGAKYAVATVNGTSALHSALLLSGVKNGDLVITQSLTFVATANAIAYCGAEPLFIDIDEDALGLSSSALLIFLEENTTTKDGQCFHNDSGRKISACVPMHTFGHPCRIDEIVNICSEYFIPVIEDAAEALGSFYKEKSAGTFGSMGVLSFNGNKIVTCGGGGAIITDDENIAVLAKHMTTTAKKPHKYEFFHDMTGFNYRMPNLNAALGCAQLEKLSDFVLNKRQLAEIYMDFFKGSGFSFIREPENSRSNYWLCSVLVSDKNIRNAFLDFAHESGVMVRPVWEPMHTLPMYGKCPRGNLPITEKIAARLINLPSGVRL
ncbi:LegC family aminotransferase [Desulforegula conservatrix]|uniref:LegC family aminotransferase n=1 Tax=Desulforegula conservatrix TaxID=153026 RepID=UPI000415DD8F|nr:LegC family aminotransferase [Desulforegula conservatrix]